MTSGRDYLQLLESRQRYQQPLTVTLSWQVRAVLLALAAFFVLSGFALAYLAR